ncbi:MULTISPECIES: hypothetical protein [Burkholderia]|uniref:hypothetical protein n=1 Tax=Burkholderia TaxID=32008 RepID=UPI001362EF3E|nr:MULTISPECIES: hypothetical protein [Burkholderia]
MRDLQSGKSGEIRTFPHSGKEARFSTVHQAVMHTISPVPNAGCLYRITLSPKGG